METNILKAIINIKNLSSYDLNEIYPPKSEMVVTNRINNVGNALETFIKDAFSNSFYEINKIEFHAKYFSYVGNENNPPDSMLIGGDAIEVKKIGSNTSQIQLNSSYPKNKLHSHDKMITEECKSCESWDTKDMLYALGIIKSKKTILNSLFLIYGDCFSADEEVYLKVKNVISDTINSLPSSEETNELGRINNVDPLGITNLRVRGMWILENPYKFFQNILNYNPNEQSFSLFSLITKDKFDSFPKNDKETILNDSEIKHEYVKILNPNNPVKQIDAIIIRYDVK